MSTAAEIETLLGATPPTKTVCHVYAVCGNSIAAGTTQVNSAVANDDGMTAQDKATYWDATHEGVWRLSNRFMNYVALTKVNNKYDVRYANKVDEPGFNPPEAAGCTYTPGLIIFPRLKALYANNIHYAYCQVHSNGVGFVQTSFDNFNLNTADPVTNSKNLTKILGRHLDLVIKHMEAKGYDVVVKGVLCLGHAVADCWDLRNANITAANLKIAIGEVIDYFRTTLGYTDVPFYFSQTTQMTAYADEASVYEDIISALNVELGDVYLHYPMLWGVLKDNVHLKGQSGVAVWGTGAEVSGNKNMAELIYQVETAGPPNGNCSGLGITVIGGGTLQLDWTNGSTDEDIISIERSLDGASYAEIATVASGVDTYTNYDLIRNTLYYYRVRAKRGYLYSSYSNVDSDTTANTGPDGSVSALATTTLDDTSIKLDWTNGSTDETGISIERSLLGVNWTEIHVTAPGVATYTNTGLVSATKYYYRVRAVKDGDYSNYSSEVIDYTAMKATVSGSGANVATFTVRVTADTVFTIDGNGKFYSDAAGTLDESTSWTPTPGAGRTRYIRVTSGTSNLLMFSKNTLTQIGGWATTGGTPVFAIDTSAISRACTVLTITGGNTITGRLADLPPLMTLLSVVGNNTMSGNLWDLPSGITYLLYRGQNTSSTYTKGKAWSTSMNYFYLDQAAGSGLSLSDEIDLLVDLDVSPWAGAGRVLVLSADNASMIDTNQGGIWGDYSGAAAPSELAVAVKSLKVTKTINVQLPGIVFPGASPDNGTGFPAGFGDWYRI